MATSLARSTALMTLGTVFSRLTGVIRLAVFAAILGVVETRFPDTYNLANTAPNIIYELVLGGLVAAVFVPVFVELLETKDRDEAWAAISGIFNLSLVVLAIFSLLGILGAPLFARFYASTLSGEEAARQQEVLIFLLRVFIPQVVLYGIYFMASGILNAHQRFVLPMFTQVLNNLVIIAVFVMFGRLYDLVTLESVTNEQLLFIGLGTTLSVAPAGLAILPAMLRLGPYRLTIKVDPLLRKRLIGLSVFLIGFVGANQLAYLVMQRLANDTQGGYTAFLAAQTFYLLPIGVFVWSITTAIVPRLSRDALNERWSGFQDTISLGAGATLFLIVPSAVGLAVLARPLVQALLEHGVVTGASTDLITGVLIFFVLGLVQFSLYLVYVRAFYSMQDAKTPFLINCVVVVLNVIVIFPMYDLLGVKGLAAGQAIAYTAGVALQLWVLRRRVGGIGLKRLAVSSGKTLLAAGVMGVAVYALANVLEDVFGAGTLGLALTFGIPTLIGAAVYLGAATLLKVEEMSFVRSVITRRAAEV